MNAHTIDLPHTDSLSASKVVHSQLKSCPLCPATFSRKTHLNRHIRSHTNERAYHCDACDAQFTRSDLLGRHKKSCGQIRSRRKSCDACAKAKVKCNLQQPCDKCLCKDTPCEFINDPRVSRAKVHARQQRNRSGTVSTVSSRSSVSSTRSPSLEPKTPVEEMIPDSPSSKVEGSDLSALLSHFYDSTFSSPQMNNSQSGSIPVSQEDASPYMVPELVEGPLQIDISPAHGTRSPIDSALSLVSPSTPDHSFEFLSILEAAFNNVDSVFEASGHSTFDSSSLDFSTEELSISLDAMTSLAAVSDKADLGATGVQLTQSIVEHVGSRGSLSVLDWGLFPGYNFYPDTLVSQGGQSC